MSVRNRVEPELSNPASYVEVIESIDWCRILLEAEGLHELKATRGGEWMPCGFYFNSQVCPKCLLERLLATDDDFPELNGLMYR